MALRILANENVPGDAVDQLRAAGHDVAWVRTESPGATDEDNLARAQRELRIVVTFDKDFGELVFHRKRSAPAGVILFRVTRPSARELAERIAEVIGGRADWSGHFSVVDEAVIRMVALPGNRQR